MHKIPMRSMHHYGMRDIFIQTLTEFSQNLHNFIRPHREEAALLYHFTKAKGALIIDQERYSIKGGETVVLRPQQVHFWEGSALPEGYVILFDARILSDKLMWSFNQLPTGQPLYLKAPIPNLLELFYQENPVEVLSQQYLQLILLHLQQYKKADSNSKPPDYQWEKVEAFKQLIEKHFHEERSPSAYAELLFISSNYLNKLVKRQTGKTAGSLIRERIVVEIKRLLRYTNASISEVATTLGFDSVSYFTTFFKKQTGQTPGAYRKETK